MRKTSGYHFFFLAFYLFETVLKCTDRENRRGKWFEVPKIPLLPCDFLTAQTIQLLNIMDLICPTILSIAVYRSIYGCCPVGKCDAPTTICSEQGHWMAGQFLSYTKKH